MFESQILEIELSKHEFMSGESEDQLACMVTIDELASGVDHDRRQALPEIESNRRTEMRPRPRAARPRMDLPPP